MNLSRLKKLAMVFVVILMAFNQISSVNVVAATKAQGDDPGVTIHSPEKINSQGLVDIDVTLSASAGKLSENGQIEVKIPKEIVDDPIQLSSMIRLTDPFYLNDLAYREDGIGNYILSVNYDATKINQNEAVGYSFTIEFRAPYFTDNTAVADNVAFTSDLKISNKVVSTDRDSSKTLPSTKGNPAFLKYSGSGSINDNGVTKYVMSPSNSQLNNFVIVFNYNHQTYENVTISDTLPEGLSLADTYPLFNGAPGNTERVGHLYVYKVTVDDKGNPTNPQLVTDNFSNNIQADSRGFSLHLGKVEADESYAITYGAVVNEGYTVENFGTQYNQATLMNETVELYSSKVPLIMQDLSPSATSLKKQVNQDLLATNSASLVYTLTLRNNTGNLKAGTVVSDPLPDYVSFDSTLSNNNFSDAVYDKSTNTVSYTLLSDIPQGESREIQLKVNYTNSSAQIGDKIINKASYVYAGSTIYSNDSVTIISGSAVLQKLDSKSAKPLAGAIFKIIDNEGSIVADNLATDADGKVNSGLLSPGEYSFVETKAPEGYVLDNTPNKFTVTSNQETQVNMTMYNTQSTRISGTKTWIDDNDANKLRPENITINLYRDNQKIDSTKIGAVNSWKYSFTDLPKYNKDGKEYVYSVKEVSVKNYTCEQDGFNFINTLNKNEKPSITPPSSENTGTVSSSTPLETNNLEGNKIKPTNGKSYPKTGEKSSFGLVVGGIILILLSVCFFYKRKRV